MKVYQHPAQDKTIIELDGNEVAQLRGNIIQAIAYRIAEAFFEVKKEELVKEAWKLKDKIIAAISARLVERAVGSVKIEPKH